MAEKRAALEHPHRTCGRAARVIAVQHPGAFRAEPVRATFPGVARDREQPEAIRRDGVHRAGARIAVLGGAVRGELSLPEVVAVLPARAEFVAPRV